MSNKHLNGNSPPTKFYCLRKETCECTAESKHKYRTYDTETLPWLKFRSVKREYEDEEGKKIKKDRKEGEETNGKKTKREQRTAREAQWNEEREAGKKVFPVFVMRFVRGIRKKIRREKKHWAEHVRGTEIVWKGHEAHHCVCCASVDTLLGQREDIKSIIDQTEWCVNQELNIVTLPLWGHTFRWYCTQMGEVRDIEKVEKRGEPKFKDRVMHNCDHDTYQNKELNPRLKKIAREVKKNKKNHEKCKKELVDDLNELVKEFADNVRERGKRKTSEGIGTHAGWKAGVNGDKKWYMPFSMAKKPRKQTFPLRDAEGKLAPGKLSAKLKKYVKGVWGIIR